METSLQKTAFSAWPPLVVSAVAWVWLGVACSHEWATNVDYSHGWIVLPLAVYFLWKRLSCATCGPVVAGGRAVAWVVLAAGAAMVLPLELGRQAPLYWRVFPWAIFFVASSVTLACAYLAGGKPFVVAGLFPLGFLASGIPWPTALEQPLTIGLMHGVASVLAAALPMAGIPAHQEGTTIVLMNCTVGIEEACSGIRSLQSAVMLALAAGEFFHLRARARLLLLATGFVLAMISNAGRTLALTLAGISGGNPAMEKIHTSAGLAALAFLAAGLFFLGWVMRRPVSENAAGGGLHPVGWKPLGWVLAAGMASFLAASGWYGLHESRGANREGRAQLAINTAAGVQESPVPPVLQSGLAPDVGSLARLVLPDGAVANGFHFFWEGSKNNAAQFYHRPDSCMPEGGWTFVGPESKAPGTIGIFPVEWTALPYEKNGRAALLLWASWVDGRQIPFSMNARSGVQRNNLWSLIANGRRTFSYETAAVLVPYPGPQPPVEEAVRAAAKMFTRP